MKSLELLAMSATDKRSAKKKKRQNLKENIKGFIVSGREDDEKEMKKLKKIKKQKFSCEQQQQEQITSNSNKTDISIMGAANIDSDLLGYIKSNSEDQRPKSKKKKKKDSLSLNQRPETDATQEVSAKKKKHKKRMYVKPEEEPCSKDNDDEEPIKKKRTLLNPNKDEYYPGMLSEMLQIKKFGRLIIPWDPSFGLDPNYKIPECKEEGLPKLKINPLFDLSKRNDHSSKDNSRNSIFVGNLPSDINVMKLKKLFRKCGLVVHAKLRRKELNKKREDAVKKDVIHKNYTNAVVKFSSPESCEAALKMNGVLYDGHHLRVTLNNEETKSNPTNSVFVGNLAYSVADNDLWKAFGECGPIESVRVIRDERSGKPKGFGFVNFKSSDSVENAVKMNGSTILNRAIRVHRHESGPPSLSDSLTVKGRKKKKKKKFVAENKLGIRETDQGLNSGGIEETSKPKDKLKIKNKKKPFQVLGTETVTHQKPKKKKKLHKKAASNQIC